MSFTSATTETRLQVIEKTKILILQEIQMGNKVSPVDAAKLVTEAVSQVSTTQNKRKSTVYSQCTRELGIAFKEFSRLVVDALLGINDDLVNKMTSNPKDQRGNDSIANIRSRMKNICGR